MDFIYQDDGQLSSSRAVLLHKLFEFCTLHQSVTANIAHATAKSWITGMTAITT